MKAKDLIDKLIVYISRDGYDAEVQIIDGNLYELWMDKEAEKNRLYTANGDINAVQSIPYIKGLLIMQGIKEEIK